jgi:hypothetical protein
MPSSSTAPPTAPPAATEFFRIGIRPSVGVVRLCFLGHRIGPRPPAPESRQPSAVMGATPGPRMHICRRAVSVRQSGRVYGTPYIEWCID